MDARGPMRAWRALRVYALIDAAGAVTCKYSVSTWCIEDDLGTDEAEGQEWGDANLNAAASHASAGYVSRSRACLERGLAEAGK